MINKKKEIQYFLLLQIGQKLIVENKSCFVAEIIDHYIRLVIGRSNKTRNYRFFGHCMMIIERVEQVKFVNA